MSEEEHFSVHVRRTSEAEKNTRENQPERSRPLSSTSESNYFADNSKTELTIGGEASYVTTDSSERWWPQILGGIVGSSATFSVTLTSGLGTVMLGQLKDGNYNVKLTGREGQWLVSVYMLGMILGTSTSITILRRIGPARLMLWQTIPNLVMTLLQTVDYKAELLITSRFMAGVAIGTCSSCSIIFIGEVCAPKLRGALLMLPGFALALGYTVSYGLGSVMSWTSLAWVVAIVPNLIMALGLLVLHESPVWLANHSRQRDAENALVFYRGSSYPAAQEVDKMMRSVGSCRKDPNFLGTIKLLRLQENLVPFLLVLVQTLGNVWSGQVAVFSYSVMIFRRLGSHLNEFHCSILLALIRLFVSLLAAAVIDRVGRRRLLLTSCMTAALGMATTGLYFCTETAIAPQPLSTSARDAPTNIELNIPSSHRNRDVFGDSSHYHEQNFTDVVYIQGSAKEQSNGDENASHVYDVGSSDFNEAKSSSASNIFTQMSDEEALDEERTNVLSNGDDLDNNHLPSINKSRGSASVSDGDLSETLGKKFSKNPLHTITKHDVGEIHSPFEHNGAIGIIPSSGQIAAISTRIKKSLTKSEKVASVTGLEIHRNIANSNGWEWLAVTGLCMAVAGVSLGIDPLTWALMGELLPAAVRDQAGAVATTVWGLAYFLVVQIFPDMNNLLGVDGTFLFFMACLIGNFLFVLLFLPETKGKSLLEIEDYFAKYKKKKSTLQSFV